MKLLSICVPTYNRPQEVMHLNNSFLKRALDSYGENIEVLMCDNSNDDVAIKNRHHLDTRIKYFQNGRNIGFAGNVLRCIDEAESEYIWLLPDNDEVIWSGFELLMEGVSQRRDVDCFLVPYVMENNAGDVVEESYSFLDRNKKYKLSNVLSGNFDFLPFVLLSGGVVRLDKSHTQEISDQLSSNIFIQIALFLSMLSEDSLVEVLPKPVIDYKVEHKGRFAPIDLFDSIIELLRFLSIKFESVRGNYQERARRAFRSIMFLLLSHYSGLSNVFNADGVRGVFFVRLIRSIDVKNILIFIVILLPKVFSGQLYICLLARDYANKKNAVTGGWFKCFIEGIYKLRSRRLSSSRVMHNEG